MNASEQLNRITRFKRSQARKDREAFVRARDPAKALKLTYCASRVDFREWIETGESKVTRAILCELRFLCETCELRRGFKLFTSSEVKVHHVLKCIPGLIPVHLTFGVRTGPDLVERLDHLRACIRAMMEGARKSAAATSRNRRQWELSKIVGAIRSIEIKRSAGDETRWNVHSHWLCLLDSFLDLEKLSRELREVSGDSFIVHARRVFAKDADADEIRSALAEVIKYPLKFSDLRPCDAWEAHHRLKGRRMIDSIGELRGISAGDLGVDPGIEEMTGPYRDWIAFWLADQQRFRIENANAWRSSLTSQNPRLQPVTP